MSILPLVALSISSDPTVVSIAPALPMPVIASITNLPLAATTSTSVSPPSTIPPAVLVRVTAVVPALVVIRPPRVISPSADKVIVALPASITVPSAIVMSPVPSWATGIAPAPFAVRLIAPLAVPRFALT